MIWFIGSIVFIVYRIFYAGMNSNTIFSSEYTDFDYVLKAKVHKTRFDSDKVLTYATITLVFGATWPVSLPIIGIYLFGKRFAK